MALMGVTRVGFARQAHKAPQWTPHGAVLVAGMMMPLPTAWADSHFTGQLNKLENNQAVYVITPSSPVLTPRFLAEAVDKCREADGVVNGPTQPDPQHDVYTCTPKPGQKALSIPAILKLLRLPTVIQAQLVVPHQDTPLAVKDSQIL